MPAARSTATCRLALFVHMPSRRANVSDACDQEDRSTGYNDFAFTSHTVPPGTSYLKQAWNRSAAPGLPVTSLRGRVAAWLDIAAPQVLIDYGDDDDGPHWHHRIPGDRDRKWSILSTHWASFSSSLFLRPHLLGSLNRYA